MMFITTVPQGHCRIIERFGKPVRVQKSGLNFVLPIFETAKDVSAQWQGDANKEGVFIELTEQLKDTRPRECITKDNAKVTADCVIRYRIVHPIKAVYEVDNLMTSLVNLVLTTLRAEIGNMNLDEVTSAQQSLSERLIATVSKSSSRWGIQIIALEIQELTMDKATSEAMLQQLEAERRSRAIVAEAEGTAAAAIKTAEASKQAAIIQAEGVKASMAMIAEAENSYLQQVSAVVGPAKAAQLLLAAKAVEGYNIMTSNPAHKVFIPNNASGIISYDGAPCPSAAEEA